MNVPNFTTQLANSLGDPTNATYSSTLLQTAMVIAVGSYGRWRKLERQFGTGHIYEAVTAGASTVLIAGGPWVVGQEISVMDSYSGVETFTVNAIAAGTPLTNWIGVPTLVTISGIFANNHAAGIFVNQTNAGLTLVAGQSNYFLANDFSAFENRSWDIANGSRAWVKRQESFYDGAYRMSDLLSGVGEGQSQTFGGISTGNGYAGVPNATGITNIPQNASTGTAYDILAGNPPQLVINPVPQSSAFLQFNYYGEHLPETVPDADVDAVIDAATAVAVAAIAQGYGGITDAQIGEDKFMYSVTMKTLVSIADEAMKRFDVKIRKRPFMITG